MKKLLLTIIGTLGVAMGSWGQSFAPNEDGSFYLTGLAIHDPNNGMTPIAADLNGKFVLSTEPNDCGRWNSKPHYILESNPDVRMVNHGEGWMLLAYTDYSNNIVPWNSTETALDMYSGENVEFPWQATSWVNEGILAAGWEPYPVGDGGYMYLSGPLTFYNQDPNNPGPNGQIIAQALELNLGLEFNNGKWVPSQE
jgi:hypothetical protein